MSSRISQKQYYDLVNSTDNLFQESSHDMSTYEAEQLQDDNNGKNKNNKGIKRRILIRINLFSIINVLPCFVVYCKNSHLKTELRIIL